MQDNTVPTDQAGAGSYAVTEPVTVRRSTVSGNMGADGGGGIYVLESTVQLLNSTVSGNAATTGGGFFVKDGSLSLNYSTVADNSATSSAGGIINGQTVVLESSIVAGNKAGDGQETSTHALLPSSPALNAADASLCPSVDQRGVSRRQGAGCDVGAY